MKTTIKSLLVLIILANVAVFYCMALGILNPNSSGSSSAFVLISLIVMVCSFVLLGEVK